MNLFWQHNKKFMEHDWFYSKKKNFFLHVFCKPPIIDFDTMVWEPNGSTEFSWPSHGSFYQKVFKNIYQYILMYFEAFLADVYNFHVTCIKILTLYIFLCKIPCNIFWYNGLRTVWFHRFFMTEGWVLFIRECLPFLYIYFHVFWTSNTQF